VTATPLVGVDGWLFLSGDVNDVIGQHTGRRKLGAQELEAWTTVFGSRLEKARTLGVDYRFYVAPDKEAVYSEYLPADVVPSAERPVHAVSRLASEAGVRFRYLLPELREGRATADVYRRTDTHWTGWGAYLAYLRICEDLSETHSLVRILGTDDMRFEPWGPLDGDLGSKLQPAQASFDVHPVLTEHRGIVTSDNFVRNHGRTMLFEQPGNGPSLLLLGDSFAGHIFVHLKESFRRVRFLHTSQFPQRLIEAERPDVVVSLMAERFLLRPPDDHRADERIAELIREKQREPYRTPASNHVLDAIPCTGLVIAPPAENVNRTHELELALRSTRDAYARLVTQVRVERAAMLSDALRVRRSRAWRVGHRVSRMLGRLARRHYQRDSALDQLVERMENSELDVLMFGVDLPPEHG